MVLQGGWPAHTIQVPWIPQAGPVVEASVAKDHYSFDEVMKNLELEEEELKRLVSAGEIRAFRDGDVMRFKAEDVARLKEDDVDLDEDLELEDLGDDLALDDAGGEFELEGGGDEELVDLGEGDLGEELELEGGDEGAEEIDLAAQARSEGPRRRGGRAAAAAPSRRAPRGAAASLAEEAPTEGAGVKAMLGISVVLLLLASAVAISAVAGRPSGLTEGIVGALAPVFGGS